MANYLIHFDGSCWPNPGGVAAYGFTIDKDGVEIAAEPGLVPEGLSRDTSNNVAEFYGVYAALKTLPVLEAGDEVKIRGDSQIVINILDGKWRPNSEKLYFDAYVLARNMARVHEVNDVVITYNWIPREANTRCDELSKEINNAKL